MTIYTWRKCKQANMRQRKRPPHPCPRDECSNRWLFNYLFESKTKQSEWALTRTKDRTFISSACAAQKVAYKASIVLRVFRTVIRAYRLEECFPLKKNAGVEPGKDLATGWLRSLSSLNLVFRKYYFWSKILDERPKGWSGRAVAGLRGSGRGARLNFGW